MKHRYIIGALIAAGLCVASCNSDIDEVYVSPSAPITVGGASDDVILNPANPQSLALTVYWSGDGQLALSDTLIQAPVNAADETIQLSNDENFSTTLDIAVEKGVRQKQFLSEELNSLLGRLGFEADQPAPLYIRIRSVLAANLKPRYSDVIKVTVQSYRIRLILGTVLDKDGNETAMTLASPDENGIYTGFMGVNGWTNWWFREANNVVWGNLGESGKTFFASSDDSHWNFWFPNPAGCYYTTLNTVEGWWSALHIDNLAVYGGITGEMTFDIKSNRWSMPIDLTQAATVSVTISGNASLYDRTTTDMGPAIAGTVGFGGVADAVTFGETASAISIDLPAGKNNLVLDLSDPLNPVLKADASEPETETEPRLYFSGLVNWDGFDDYISLYDEGTLSYGGAHWIDSEWGYRAYTQPDWTAAYKGGDDAQPLEGSLVAADSDGNIPAPEKGLYVLDFNMQALTYKLTKVETVGFTGLNDDWTVNVMTQSDDNPELFTAEFVKEKETPWGVKVLINNNWSLFFGGGDGSLRLGHSDATTGFDGDNALAVGETYILTVDLGKQTYSYSLK